MRIATSTFYAAKQRGRVSDAALEQAYAAKTAHTVFVNNGRPYGVRKMWHALTALVTASSGIRSPADGHLGGGRSDAWSAAHDHDRTR